MSQHTSWCHSNELELCSGCSVLKGHDRSPATGEPTTCRNGEPHEWLPKPCNCGPNDKRRGDRRMATPEASPPAEGKPPFLLGDARMVEIASHAVGNADERRGRTKWEIAERVCSALLSSPAVTPGKTIKQVVEKAYAHGYGRGASDEAAEVFRPEEAAKEYAASPPKWIAELIASPAVTERGEPTGPRTLCRCGHARWEHKRALPVIDNQELCYCDVDSCRCRDFAAPPEGEQQE